MARDTLPAYLVHFQMAVVIKVNSCGLTRRWRARSGQTDLHFLVIFFVAFKAIAGARMANRASFTFHLDVATKTSQTGGLSRLPTRQA